MNDLLQRSGRRTAPDDELPVWDSGVGSPPWAGVLAAILLIVGTVAVSATDGRGRTGPGLGDRPPPPVEVFAGTSSYPAGHSSGWHRHPALHRVRVIAGTLTVYDQACTPSSYGPGEEYVGGHRLHLARNETDADLEMTVTYLLDPDTPLSALHVEEPAPTGCLSV